MFILIRFILVLLLLFVSNSCAIYDSRKVDWDSSTPTSEGSVKLYFKTAGDGEPVILIHGFAANSYTWRYLIPALSKTHKVYSLDLKGFGNSPKPVDSAYTIIDQAKLVVSFIEENKLENFSIVGHSYGGGVSLFTTLLLQRKSSAQLKKLVLLDSIAYRQEVPFFIELLATPVLGGLVSNTVPFSLQVNNVLQKAYYNDKLISDETIAAYAKPLEQTNAVSALTATARSIIPSDIENISNEYQNISIPTKIIWGRYDEIVPLQIGEKLNQAIEGSTLEVVDNCGHIPQEECPNEAIPIIVDFLSNG